MARVAITVEPYGRVRGHYTVMRFPRLWFPSPWGPQCFRSTVHIVFSAAWRSVEASSTTWLVKSLRWASKQRKWLSMPDRQRALDSRSASAPYACRAGSVASSWKERQHCAL